MLEKIMHYAQEYKDGKIDFLTLEFAVDTLLSASNEAKPVVSGALCEYCKDDKVSVCCQDCLDEMINKAENTQ